MSQGPQEPRDDDEPTQPYAGSSESPPPWEPPSGEQPYPQSGSEQPYDQPPGDQQAYDPQAYGQQPYGQQPGDQQAYGQQPYDPQAYGQQPGYGYPPPPGYPVPAGVSPQAPYGVHPVTGVPYSDKQKLVAGLLQLLIPLGIGRMYIGDTGVGVAQLLVTIFTCGIGAVWPFIDGILILVGDKTDVRGLPLRP